MCLSVSVCREGLLVDIGVSGPIPCVPSLFGGHLPLSVPVPIPVIVVMVVVASWPVMVVRALPVAFIVVLFSLLGAMMPHAVARLVRPTAVMVVVVVVVVPVGHRLVALLLLVGGAPPLDPPHHLPPPHPPLPPGGGGECGARCRPSPCSPCSQGFPSPPSPAGRGPWSGRCDGGGDGGCVAQS